MASTSAVPTESDADDFYSIAVAAVRRELEDTVSLVLDIPETLRERFAYRAGQYVTLRVAIDGRRLSRSYSMSSAPQTDDALRITIKRVEDGRVSRWITESLRAGDSLEVMPPAGRFCLRRDDGPLVLLGGGSGITPLISLAKAALATTARPVSLLFANRDHGSIIFARELDELAAAYRDRFRLIHWLDSEQGFLDADRLGALGIFAPDADFYICGPTAFMEIVEAAVLPTGADREHIFVERFVSPPDETAAPADGATSVASETCETLTLVLRGTESVINHRPGEVIVEAAWRAGIRPPVSCLLGSCATCMARVTRGTVRMRGNDVLMPSEVAEGYVLTCQGVPTSREVTVVYES
jgi:3-ketosteroid 9alpha-monooxygenase subunit B